MARDQLVSLPLAASDPSDCPDDGADDVVFVCEAHMGLVDRVGRDQTDIGRVGTGQHLEPLDYECWATRRGRTDDLWLARMLARKPRMLVAVAPANRMACIVWALAMKKETYRVPAAA